MRRVVAVNLSPILLLALERDSSLVDAVKVSEFSDPQYVQTCKELAPYMHLLLHGVCQCSDWGRFRPPAPGNPYFRESIDLSALKTALDVAKPDYISVHLERTVGGTVMGDEREEVRASGPAHDSERFLSTLVEDVEFLRSLTRLPVHLENTYARYAKESKYRDTGTYVSEPSFIAEAVTSTGSRFLLDIAHAQVAAWYRNQAVEAYLAHLPMESVDEVHVCAPAMVDGELRDRHAELDEEGYRLLENLLAGYAIKTVSLEYGGFGPLFEGRESLQALLRQLTRLREMLAGTGRSVIKFRNTRDRYT